jgi:hypothetical protein
LKDEWSKSGAMGVPSLSKLTGTTRARNPSAAPTGGRRKKIVELARNRCTPKELAEEFEPTQVTTSGCLSKRDGKPTPHTARHRGVPLPTSSSGG